MWRHLKEALNDFRQAVWPEPAWTQLYRPSGRTSATPLATSSALGTSAPSSLARCSCSTCCLGPMS
jgi:hypothetical protein